MSTAGGIPSNAPVAAATTTTSSSAWNKPSKNTQSLDRSLKKSKGSRMFSRNTDYESGPLSFDVVAPDAEMTLITSSSDARVGTSGYAAAVGGWLSNTFSAAVKEKSAHQPIPSPKHDGGAGDKFAAPSTGSTPPLSL